MKTRKIVHKRPLNKWKGTQSSLSAVSFAQTTAETNLHCWIFDNLIFNFQLRQLLSSLIKQIFNSQSSVDALKPSCQCVFFYLLLIGNHSLWFKLVLRLHGFLNLRPELMLSLKVKWLTWSILNNFTSNILLFHNACFSFGKKFFHYHSIKPS